MALATGARATLVLACEFGIRYYLLGQSLARSLATISYVCVSRVGNIEVGEHPVVLGLFFWYQCPLPPILPPFLRWRFETTEYQGPVTRSAVDDEDDWVLDMEAANCEVARSLTA